MRARRKGREAAAEGYAYLSCHYVIALQVRNRPSSKHAALFQRNDQQGDEKGGCTSHHIRRKTLLSGRAAVRPACSRVHPRKVSLFFSLSLSLSLAPSSRLCPSLLRSLVSFRFFSSPFLECESETRCDTSLDRIHWPESSRLHPLAAGWIH